MTMQSRMTEKVYKAEGGKDNIGQTEEKEPVIIWHEKKKWAITQGYCLSNKQYPTICEGNISPASF